MCNIGNGVDMKKNFILIIIMVFLSCLISAAETVEKKFYVRGAFYQDWMGFKTGDSDFYNRFSSRLNMTLWNKPGDGPTLFVDVRDRYTAGDGGKNQLMLYDVRLAFDSMKSKIFFSLGQMNLYDTAGIGHLAGALAGYKLGKYLSVGAYGGFEPDIFNNKVETDYRKYGGFIRYIGKGAKQFSFSYNYLRYKGKNERQYIYASLLLPVSRSFILYGNVEYDLGALAKSSDRLAQLFLNSRANITKYADVTLSYSSGRGLDYHEFLIEQSQDPTIQNSDIERFYYNETYGARLALKPSKNLRVYISRQESTQKDLNIKNHTTGLGFSVNDLFKTGFSLYGNYNMNRGDSSESDTYYISASKSFGKIYWNLSYANYFNGVRFTTNGTPVIVRILLPDQQTVSTGLFFILNRTVSVSLDYSYIAQTGNNGHQIFIRLILRK